MNICTPRAQCSVDSFLGMTILMPSFLGYIGVGPAQLLFIAICISWSLIILYFNKKFEYPESLRKIPVIFVCQFIFYVLTILTNSVNPFSLISAKDATDILRPALYLLYFSIPVLLRYDSVKCIRIIAIGIGIGVVFDLLKFFPGFYPIMRLYTHLDPNGLNYARFNGTFTYCYSFGFIVLLLFAYSLNANYRHRIISILVLIVVLFLTGSRSIILATFCLIIFQILFFGGNLTSKLKYFTLSIGIIILFYLILSDMDIPLINQIFKLLERGIDSVAGNGTDGSFDNRGNQLTRALDNFYSNPLLGVGPQKGSENPIENLIGYYISSWGLAGSLCYLTIWFSFLYFSFKCSSVLGSVGRFSKSNFLWILMVPFAGASAPITEGIRLAPLYYVVQGVQAVMYFRYYGKYINGKQKIPVSKPRL